MRKIIFLFSLFALLVLLSGLVAADAAACLPTLTKRQVTVEVKNTSGSLDITLMKKNLSLGENLEVGNFLIIPYDINAVSYCDLNCKLNATGAKVLFAVFYMTNGLDLQGQEVEVLPDSEETVVLGVGKEITLRVPYDGINFTGTCSEDTGCADGTAGGECSAVKPYYCKEDSGSYELTANVIHCGCAPGHVRIGNACELPECVENETKNRYCTLNELKGMVCADGHWSMSRVIEDCSVHAKFCAVQSGLGASCVASLDCSDGTPRGQCSSTKPLYCVNGQLANNASACGCPANYEAHGDVCIALEGCSYGNPACNASQQCVNNTCVTIPAGCAQHNPDCDANSECVNNTCVPKTGCSYGNPACNASADCINNICVPKAGCSYGNPPCSATEQCVNNSCAPRPTGCAYHNPDCPADATCLNNTCIFSADNQSNQSGQNGSTSGGSNGNKPFACPCLPGLLLGLGLTVAIVGRKRF